MKDKLTTSEKKGGKKEKLSRKEKKRLNKEKATGAAEIKEVKVRARLPAGTLGAVKGAV